MAASSDFGVFLARSIKALRDLFIYLLPGGTFLALVIHAVGVCPAYPEALPAWIPAALVLGACYITGTFITILSHVLVSLFFQSKGVSRLKAVAQQLGLEPETSPTAAEDQRLRFHFPALFEEADRIRLIADFRLSLAVALMLAGLPMLMHAHDEHGHTHAVMALVGGFLLFLNARSAGGAARGVFEATRDAARALPVPHAKTEKE